MNNYIADAERIAVIIPYFRGEKHLTNLLASVARSSVDCCVIIVDNSPVSAQLTPEKLTALSIQSPPQVLLVNAPPAIGFGRACNLGARIAKKHNLSKCVIVNQDAEFFDGALESLLTSYRTLACDVISPIQLDPVSSELSDFVAKSYVPDSLNEDNSVRPLAEIPRSPVEVGERVSAACLLFRTDLFEEIGGFDPLYHMYGEDNEFVQRVVKSSMRIFLDRSALIGHAHSNTSATARHREQIFIWRAESSIVRLLTSPAETSLSRAKDLLKVRLWLAKRILHPPWSRTFPALVRAEVATWKKAWAVLQSSPHVLERWRTQTTSDLLGSKIFEVSKP